MIDIYDLCKCNKGGVGPPPVPSIIPNVQKPTFMLTLSLMRQVRRFQVQTSDLLILGCRKDIKHPLEVDLKPLNCPSLCLTPAPHRIRNERWLLTGTVTETATAGQLLVLDS